MDSSNFSLKGGQGFQITFENGYTVSVQFGEYHYCSNRNLGSPTCEETVHDCANAETAIFYKGDRFLEYKGDTVQSYQSPKEVLETLKYAESLPNPEDQAIIDIMGKSKKVLYTDEGTPIYFAVSKEEE